MKKIIFTVAVIVASLFIILSAFAGTEEEGRAYFKKAIELWVANDCKGALENYEQALKIFREIGYRLGEGVIFSNISMIYLKLGQYEKALSYHEQALKIYREIGDRNREAGYLGTFASVYMNLSQYEKALSYDEQAMKIYRDAGDRKGEATSLNSIGNVYLGLGQHEKALSYYEQALKIYREIGDRGGEASTLGNIGVVFRNLGQYEKALSYYEQALKINRETGNRDREASNLGNIGVMYMDLGQYEKALSYHEQALKIRQETGDPEGEEIQFVNIGVVYIALGQYEKALSYYGEALKINRENGDLDGVYKSAAGMGMSYRRLKKYSDAVAYFVMSLDALESMRGEIESEESKTSFMEDKMGVYRELIETLVELGRFEEAFDYMERSRSRAFLDLLASGSFAAKKPMDKEAQEKDRKYQALLSALRNDLIKDPGNTSLKSELERLEKEYAAFIKDVASKNSELASLVSVSSLTLKDVQTLLDGKTTVLEYLSTGKKTFVFLVTKTGLTVYTIPIKDADLTAKVNDTLIPNISNKTRRPESVIEAGKPAEEVTEAQIEANRQKFQKDCVAFYDLLVRPVANDITTENLIIVPYGALHKVPFSALNDGTNYLIDRYSISVLPSASVLSYLKDKGGSNGNRLLAFSNPKTDAVPLFFAEAEVNEIMKVFGNNTVYAKEKATETVFKGVSGKYDVVHLACHGEFNDTSPILSCLLLSKDGTNDGYLRLNELFGLDLGEANLVALSACETGLSKVQGGDDLVGLSRGLIYAGAESILASLWSVDDKSTAILMTKFYENWKSGMTKAEALRKAQIELKSMEGYSHPFYWAAFELIGDGR